MSRSCPGPGRPHGALGCFRWIDPRTCSASAGVLVMARLPGANGSASKSWENLLGGCLPVPALQRSEPPGLHLLLGSVAPSF